MRPRLLLIESGSTARGDIPLMAEAAVGAGSLGKIKIVHAAMRNPGWLPPPLVGFPATAYVAVMARPPQSIAVVGADYPNKRGPTRRFEIAMCSPGEPVELRREPKNPADSRAIGVYSTRGIQIGYVPADYAQWIGGQVAVIRAIFQRVDTFGAVIRVTFDGSEPTLPVEKSVQKAAPHRRDPDGYGDDDWPPREPNDDFSSI